MQACSILVMPVHTHTHTHTIHPSIHALLSLIQSGAGCFYSAHAFEHRGKELWMLHCFHPESLGLRVFYLQNFTLLFRMCLLHCPPQCGRVSVSWAQALCCCLQRLTRSALACSRHKSHNQPPYNATLPVPPWTFSLFFVVFIFLHLFQFCFYIQFVKQHTHTHTHTNTHTHTHTHTHTTHTLVVVVVLVLVLVYLYNT